MLSRAKSPDVDVSPPQAFDRGSNCPHRRYGFGAYVIDHVTVAESQSLPKHIKMRWIPVLLQGRNQG